MLEDLKEQPVQETEQVTQTEDVSSTEVDHESADTVQVQSLADEVKKTKSPDEIQANNFKAMRQKMAAIERERDELVSKLKDTQTTHKRDVQPIEAEEDLDLNIAPDDLAEGKHLTKVAKKIKQLEAQIKSYQQNTVAITAEAKLKAEHPDIETVVSADNIQTLRDMYPELADTLSANNDLYTKAKAAYTMIKKLGIHSDDSNIPEKQIAQRNIAKPKPLVSVSPQQGESPIARANMFANGLTPELKAQLRKEMDESAKMM